MRKKDGGLAGVGWYDGLKKDPKNSGDHVHIENPGNSNCVFSKAIPLWSPASKPVSQ